MLAKIAGPARLSAEIKLGCYIESIATPSSRNADGQVMLKTSDGQFVSFDEVVVTSPLGWLKNNLDSFFDPPPTPRLTSAIESIGYGNLDKIYVPGKRHFTQIR